MPRSIGSDEVRELTSRGAQLVEVLPRDEYEEEHLEGALSIPLKTLDRGSVDSLDRGKPTIVYCWDSI
jgi:rhodanese-related sulfurtransferase